VEIGGKHDATNFATAFRMCNNRGGTSSKTDNCTQANCVVGHNKQAAAVSSFFFLLFFITSIHHLHQLGPPQQLLNPTRAHAAPSDSHPPITQTRETAQQIHFEQKSHQQWQPLPPPPPQAFATLQRWSALVGAMSGLTLFARWSYNGDPRLTALFFLLSIYLPPLLHN